MQLQSQSYSDHDYYLDRGWEPPRFAQYRLARAKHKIGETKAYQDFWDSVTQDELDYYLKSKLREPPEQRYQRHKEVWYFHDSSWSMRGLEATGYDGKGCNQFTGCIPECRYYAEYGSVEDEEVITDHNKWVEFYSQRNAIVEPSTLLSSLSPLEQQRPYFQEYYEERDQP